jgi:hypothetical protein
MFWTASLDVHSDTAPSQSTHHDHNPHITITIHTTAQLAYLATSTFTVNPHTIRVSLLPLQNTDVSNSRRPNIGHYGVNAPGPALNSLSTPSQGQCVTIGSCKVQYVEVSRHRDSGGRSTDTWMVMRDQLHGLAALTPEKEPPVSTAN